MGAATSLEEIEEVKMILSADNPRFNSMSPMSKELLKAALTSKDLSDSKIRRLRAAALGRRCVCVVEIGSGGFSLQHVLLCEGQVVSFKVNDENGDDEDYRIKQVVDNGEEMVDVMGGYGNDTLPVGDHYEQQFNLAGEYRFVIDDNKTHLLVEVHPRKDIEATVTDSGFEPSIIRLDEGNSVVWSWEESAIPRYVREASFEVDRWIMRPYRDSKVPTRSGTFKKTFNKPGMYYFQASGMNSDESHFCIVQVRERQREYRVMVEDDRFDPQIIVIEEGDRIWWDWTKNEGERYHCVFEANVSPKDGKIEPSKTNFSWTNPTKFGLMSREYFEAGIYFYGDREFKKVANYVCTVIVKPAQRDHFIEVNKAGFAPDILQVSLGDRTWYTWLIERDEEVTDVEEFVVELEKVTTGDQPKCGPEKSDEQFMDAILSKQKYRVGLELATANQIGVYHHHHKLSGGTCSLICQDGFRNHTITVTDSGFEPLHLTAYLNDRVWWIWQDAKRKHFILQVNSSGREADGGFSSGYPMFSPSAFMFQFVEAGKYHYKSTGHIEDIFGIIDVHVRPTVRTVVVEPGRMEPEPVTIATGDVVAWTFTRPTPHEVEEVNTFDDVINAQVVPRGILPRKCMSKSFRKPGVYHHASKSFVNPKNSSSRPEDQPISSVIVSEVEDAVTVRIDNNGYHPNHLDLPEDDFVIFDWKKSKQAHNVFEVDKNGRAIEYNNNNNNDADDGEGFTRSVIRSGEPEKESSFVHYFDLSGVFRVASANGKDGEMCVIDVKKNAVDKTPAPQIVDYEFVSLKVRRGHVVHLTCAHPKAEIYYTLDGGLPYLHRRNVQRYDRARGIELSRVGITFIRAVAVATGCRRSDVFTSKKFFVLPGDDDDYGKTPLRNKDGGDKEEEEMIDQIIINATPIIDGSSIIRWDLNQKIFKRASGLQLDINGITSNLSVHPQSKGLKISGLSPDTNYNVKVVSYLDEGQPPLHSNALTLQNSHKDGRMSITLKSAPTPDSVLLMWKHLDEQVQGYQVFLNGAACGHVILPDQEAYSILLSNLKFRTTNKVSVAAILKDGKGLRHSNEVHFLLPSNERCVLLPGSEGIEIIPIEELTPIGNKKGVRFAVPKSDTGSSDGQKSTVRELIAKKRNFTTLLSAEAVDDDSVPMAHLTVKSERDNNSILVSWIFKKEFSEDFKRTSNYINVIGKSFGPNVNSDLSFECFMETNEAVPAIQHVWNVSAGDNHCLVEGLKEDTVYKIHAVTCYEKIELSNDEKILEVQATSPSVTYKTQQKSKCRLNLKVISSEPNKAKLTWSRDCLSVKSAIVGYQIIADGNPMGNLIDPNLNEILLEKLLPGKSVNVGVIPKLEDPNEVVPIETIQIFCPRRPMPPVISEHPTNNKLKSAIIAWNYPEQGSQNERQGHDDDDTDQLDINDDISTFRVYVDNKCKDVIKVTPSRTKHGYQCTLDQLISGGSHDVFVTSCVGNDDDVTATTDVVMISSESVPSNIVSISLPVPAQSPQLRIENMNSNGIELSWDVLQQNGDEQIAGYQLYKNNKLYGSMLPSHAHNTTIKNLKLGESINLKMVAVPKEKGQYKDELENGVSIKVEYSGIVSAPTRVWTEKVTGHSAIIKWSMGEQLDHYDKPDSYQLTWWPGTRADSDISSASTSDEQMTLAGLKEGKLYTVVVESRSKHSYIEVNGTSREEINRSIIVTSRSDPLTFHTSSPLSPPSDLAINSTTCDSVLITWEFNGEDATNVLGYRIDAIPTKDIRNGNQNSPDLVTYDLPRGSRQAKVIGLKEYLITLTVVTKEYFEQTDADSHKSKKKHLPKGQPAPRNRFFDFSPRHISTIATAHRLGSTVVRISRVLLIKFIGYDKISFYIFVQACRGSFMNAILYVCLFVSLLVCLFVCLFIFLYPSNS